VTYFWHAGPLALVVIGGAFVAVTGGEAFYADMGHFGPIPIRIAWFGVALSALALNHFGQGGLRRFRQFPQMKSMTFSWRGGSALSLWARQLSRVLCIRTTTMLNTEGSSTFTLGERSVNRLGYGAMQLAGPGVFGPPRDRANAVAVLRAAVARGVNHIDTSDFYGPHITNQIICEALRPYPDDLVIVTKVGARRGPFGSVHPAMSREDITRAVHDNLRNLGLDVLDVVNMRSMLRNDGPAEGSIEAPLIVLADLQRQGLLRHIGLSNVTPAQVAEGRRICDIVCVQNLYNVMQRDDDALIDELAAASIAYMPYFPLGGLRPLESATLSEVAARVGAAPMQVALAWLLQRSANILPIPGTASLTHLSENLAAATLDLPPDEIDILDRLAPRRPDIKQ
jgi:pyridoxine 4-dehydrogenase